MDVSQEHGLPPHSATLDQSTTRSCSRSPLSLKAFLDETEEESQRWPYTSRERYYRSSAYLDAAKSPFRSQSASGQSIPSPYAASSISPGSPIIEISNSKKSTDYEDKKCDKLPLPVLTSTSPSTNPSLPSVLSIAHDTNYVKEGKEWESDEGGENIEESEPLILVSPTPRSASPSDISSKIKRQRCKGAYLGFRKFKEAVNARIEKVADVFVQKLMQRFAPIFTVNARAEMEIEDVRPRLLIPLGSPKCDFDDYDAPSHDTGSIDAENDEYKGIKKGKKKGKEA